MSDSFNATSPALTASFSLARRLTAAEVRAVGAVQTANFAIATLGPGTVVKRALMLVNGQAAGVTTLLFSLGFDPAGPYEDYESQHDVIADGPGALLSTAPSLTSTSVPCAGIPSLTAETPIIAVLTASTGAETLAAVTGFDLSIYFECVVLPS